MNRSDLARRPPPAILRAAISLVLLVGFYVVLLGTAAVLFIVPALVVYASVSAGQIGLRLLMILAVGWIPAALLASSVFTARRPAFKPPGRRLEPSEAPGLFAAIAELAAAGGTAPPLDVYLDAFPNLAVTDTGGMFRSRRVLIIGAPLLHFLTIDELRAGIAHELGHFIGGDTRLTAFTVQTHALFASVARSVQRDAFRSGTQHFAIEGGFALAEAIGRALVGGYGRLFLRIMRPLDRRQEYAADAFSAQLVSPSAAIAALEKIAVRAPLYQGYLEGDVGFAVRNGAMPSDLSAGFATMSERVLTTDRGRGLVEAVTKEATHVYDTHPALADRVSALSEGTTTPVRAHDPTPALSWLADAAAVEAWLVEATRERVVQALVESAPQLSVRAVRPLAWSLIPKEAYAPTVHEAARSVAERLHPLFTEATTMRTMFSALWRSLEGGRAVEVLRALHPRLAPLPRPDAERAAVHACNGALVTLMQGALLEHGAAIHESLGEPALVFQLEDERVVPHELVEGLFQGGPEGHARFKGWADRFATA